MAECFKGRERLFGLFRVEEVVIVDVLVAEIEDTREEAMVGVAIKLKLDNEGRDRLDID